MEVPVPEEVPEEVLVQITMVDAVGEAVVVVVEEEEGEGEAVEEGEDEATTATATTMPMRLRPMDNRIDEEITRINQKM